MRVAERADAGQSDAEVSEGADAIWLAAPGWTVTAVDASVTALERGARQAAAEGDQIAARITWPHDLTLPPGRTDSLPPQTARSPTWTGSR